MLLRRMFPVNFLSRIQLALQSTLQYRCEEIARVINELGTKELQNALPLLLADLFGISSGGAVLSPRNPLSGITTTNAGQGVGWGLRTLLHSSEFTDYNVLYQFLHPQGPVFHLLYRLMQDCHLKYEFPLHFLPPCVKQMILTGVVPPFYADKLQLDPQTRVPVCLALNPFELYIFHFAFHLVNPELQRSQSTAWQYADSLYLSLIEVYLSELLPCDRSHVNPSVPYTNAIPSYAVYGLRRQVPQSPTKTLNASQLFRQSILQQSSSPGSLHASQAASVTSSHTEIWRSETVAQVFVDFWLNYGESDTNIYGRATPPRELLPSAEHICVVRNLIKHLHYFSNSEANDGSAMDELRKVIVPSSQARIYAFLRRTIHRWPLDSSFRFILETWLSYIQPWRYTDHRFRNNLQMENDGTRLDRRGVDSHWLPFIADNLLSYTVIFQEILPRFGRLDLSTPKNASMLFRVAKVFSQPMLCTFVREIESALEEPSMSSFRCAGDPSEGAHQTSKWAATVRQQIQDLEIPGFQYKAMFGAETRAQVVSLLDIVRQSEAVADATQRSLQLEAEKKARAQSVVSRLRDWFVTDASTADEYSPEERIKVLMYLQTTVIHMCTIFGIREDELPEVNRLGRDATDGRGQRSDRCETPVRRAEVTPPNAQVPSPSLAFLTMKSTPQQWRQRALNITFEGDPDQLPIRSDESAMMVRLLYQASCRLNEVYGQDMIRLYNLNNVWGRVARLILLPPIRVRRFNKIPGSFSPCVETPLPPRLSLRPLARHMLLLGLPAICALASVSNIPPALALLLALSVWALYIFAQALLQPYCQAPRREVRRVNFDDSFLNESAGNISF